MSTWCQTLIRCWRILLKKKIKDVFLPTPEVAATCWESVKEFLRLEGDVITTRLWRVQELYVPDSKLVANKENLLRSSWIFIKLQEFSVAEFGNYLKSGLQSGPK
ncbi:uncharacterized protein LOC118189836 isoform X2 [Stegodyphus dumicola]|uniref:uncharacterized protein LOC118189836 isoform X2 n=1 Tax=Stegodyphus dumicola TaxID=202533 RepID=UPI0015B08206|nr:uncharacterized protein LOC118189836 isoform X2 [Stegodyphus dumicola]